MSDERSACGFPKDDCDGTFHFLRADRHFCYRFGRWEFTDAAKRHITCAGNCSQRFLSENNEAVHDPPDHRCRYEGQKIAIGNCPRFLRDHGLIADKHGWAVSSEITRALSDRRRASRVAKPVHDLKDGSGEVGDLLARLSQEDGR